MSGLRNREAVKICIPSEKGKVLAALHDGALVCEESQGDSRDDQWLFVKALETTVAPALVFPNSEIESPPPGYNIVSANFKLVMDYDPSVGEQVSVVPYNEIDRTHTTWHVTEDDEIYTYDREGNRKYLWSVLGNVYVTPDEYLAETWKAVSLEGFDVPLESGGGKDSQKSHSKWVILLLLLVAALLAYLFYRKR